MVALSGPTTTSPAASQAATRAAWSRSCPRPGQTMSMPAPRSASASSSGLPEAHREGTRRPRGHTTAAGPARCGPARSRRESASGGSGFPRPRAPARPARRDSRTASRVLSLHHSPSRRLTSLPARSRQRPGDLVGDRHRDRDGVVAVEPEHDVLPARPPPGVEVDRARSPGPRRTARPRAPSRSTVTRSTAIGQRQLALTAGLPQPGRLEAQLDQPRRVGTAVRPPAPGPWGRSASQPRHRRAVRGARRCRRPGRPARGSRTSRPAPAAECRCSRGFRSRSIPTCSASSGAACRAAPCR